MKIEYSYLNSFTPWEKLNNFTGELFLKNNISIINSSFNVGVSIFLINIAKHRAIDNCIPTYLIVNDINKTEIYDRIICNITGLNLDYIKNGLYNKSGEEKNKNKILKAIKKMNKSPLYIEELTNINNDINEIKKKIKFMKMYYDIENVILDIVSNNKSFLVDLFTMLKEDIVDKEKISVISTFKTNQVKGIEYIIKICTSVMILKKNLIKKKKKKNYNINYTHELVVEKNKYGQKHNDQKNKYIPLKFNEEKMEFKEV
jgi:hypothetical protein